MIDYQNYINRLIMPAYLEKIYTLLLRTNHEINLAPGKIKVTSGRLRGFMIRFYDDNSCIISCYRSYFSFDLNSEFTPHSLLRLLVKHNMLALHGFSLNVLPSE